MIPRILIPVPTSTDVAYNQRSWPQYASCVGLAGGEPVRLELTLSASEMRQLATGCDGILLPGSPADVNPALYGAERLPESAPADPAREAADCLLLEHAVGGDGLRPKPILAICYGLQSLNTWRGGSLLQDLSPLPVNHEAGGKIGIAHTAIVAADSLLASLLTLEEAPLIGSFHRLPINSSHHQAIAAPGEGLRIVARCPEDGVIEAIELDPAFPALDGALFHVEHSLQAQPFVVGVQWHPERSYSISAASRALFDRFLAESQIVASARATVATAST